jgi:ABC-type multidrug transport system fused ATPase/permease subunit
MKRNLHLLTTPGFLLGLSLLLANDFLFKPVLHNWLTGKLSDFAGLFIFPLFWTALAPKAKRAIFLLTATGFALWKSALSQPLIDEWNYLSPLTLARQVDASDLLALCVLIPSYKYHSKFSVREQELAPGFKSRRAFAGLVIVISLFAFTATSYRTRFDYTGQEFVFADTKEGLIKRFERFPHAIYKGNSWETKSGPDEYELTIIVKDFCFGQIRALVEIKEEDARRSRLILKMLQHECPEHEGDKDRMLLIFNHEIIERLQNDIDALPRDSAASKR